MTNPDDQAAAPTKVKNILFIMADQLRRDYLSCYGARHLHTLSQAYLR